jgi:hypothetical protein
MVRRKPKKKAVRDFITGKILYYEGSKTREVRDIITGKVYKRVSTKKAKETGIYGFDTSGIFPKRKKKKKSNSLS